MRVGENPITDVMIAAKILAHEVYRRQAGHIELDFADAATDFEGKGIDIRVTVEIINEQNTPKPKKRS